MQLAKLPYKGTRDFFPKQMRQREFLFSKMKEVAELFSFEPYDGPLIEEVELYKAKSGEELINDQIYAFIDRGDRHVAIRPEMTPTLARMVAQVHREISKPIRWYSIPNLMRYEKPQKGRLREHWQFNCDIFGAPAHFAELEILQVITTFLKGFGANNSHFEISLNDRRIVDAIFNNLLKVEAETSYKLYKVIDKSKKVSPEALDKMISEHLSGDKKEILLAYLKLTTINELESFVKKYNLEDSTLNFFQFSSKLPAWGLSEFVVYDPTIVRGLDYYTGIVFEVFDKHPENRRAICGGGAYGNLLQIFNEPALAGVGFGMGDVTLADFLIVHNLMPSFEKGSTKVLISYMDESCEMFAQKWAQKLRSINVTTEFMPDTAKPKKVFTYAEKMGHKYVAIIGLDEVKEQTLSLKNPSTQETIKINFDIKELQ